MVRKFLTLDGDVLEESEWQIKPTDKCFYCDIPFHSMFSDFDDECWGSQDGNHDWITIVNPSDFRR